MPIANSKEVDTSYIAQLLKKFNKQIIVSKSNFENFEMSHYLMTGDTVYLNNKYNIAEPQNAIEINIEKIDVVFVPLLAFDRSGNRVGYGKGFYDRFLSKCKPTCVFIGLSFFDSENSIDDNSQFDKKLHFCVLPNKIVKFG